MGLLLEEVRVEEEREGEEGTGVELCSGVDGVVVESSVVDPPQATAVDSIGKGVEEVGIGVVLVGIVGLSIAAGVLDLEGPAEAS